MKILFFKKTVMLLLFYYDIQPIYNINTNLKYASNYITNSANNLNNQALENNVKPNINNINVVHNNGIASNDVNKKTNKNIVLKYKKTTVKNTTKNEIIKK